MPFLSEHRLPNCADIHGNTNLDRSFLVHEPSFRLADGKKFPAVFAFHGLESAADFWVPRLEYFVKHGDFVAVYAVGLNRCWNLGVEPSNADELDYTDKIVADVKKMKYVDSDRFFALGMSNGAGMVWKLLCERSYFHRAVVLTTSLRKDQRRLLKWHPVSVMQIMSLDDFVVPYSGGTALTGPAFEHSEEAARYWSEQNRCTEEYEKVISQATGNICLKFMQGTNSCCVEHYGIVDAGHSIPEDLKDDELFIKSGLWQFVVDFLLRYDDIVLPF